MARRRVRTTAAGTGFAAGLAVVVLVVVAVARAGEADPRAAFLDAFERGDAKAAMAALSPALRDASPYDEKTAALPPFARDMPIYVALAERFSGDAPVTEAARAEAVVHFDVAVLAWREGDMERARRRLLLALSRDPFDRMAHLYAARAYRALEAKALETPEAKSAGEILHEKVGAGSSDQHVDFAEEIVEKRYPADLQSITVNFTFDQGTVKDVKTERGKASGNARMQRAKVAAPEDGELSIVLVGADHGRLDEAWFPAVQTLYVDGGTPENPTHGKEVSKTFSTSLELLEPRPAARVMVYDATGKRIFDQAVEPPAPPK